MAQTEFSRSTRQAHRYDVQKTKETNHMAYSMKTAVTGSHFKMSFDYLDWPRLS